MVFCNKLLALSLNSEYVSHNPYFNRWFSAIYVGKNNIEDLKKSQSLF